MIDFIEDKNEIDFQVEGQSQPMNNNIDFQPETNTQNTNNGIDFQPAKLEGKVEYNEELSPYDMVLRDTKLTKEQKVQKIKEIGEAERKKIDREHRIKMAKLYGGAALEIGSCLIPFGGAANIGGRLALRLAKPAFSQIAKRVIARNVGRGIGSGLASGAMFGAGNGLMEDKDIKGIAQSTVEGAGTGMAFGGAIGGAAGKNWLPDLNSIFSSSNKLPMLILFDDDDAGIDAGRHAGDDLQGSLRRDSVLLCQPLPGEPGEERDAVRGHDLHSDLCGRRQPRRHRGQVPGGRDLQGQERLLG